VGVLKVKNTAVRFFLFFFTVISLCVPSAHCGALRISQIDNSSLLINQQVRLYLSVTDENGKSVKNLTEDQFSVYEMGKERDIDMFRRGININQGINLLLVLDNSGSMYWDGTGKNKNSSDISIWRITYAKDAVVALMNQMKNPMDRVGLISFNVKPDVQTKLTEEKVEVVRGLDLIGKPSEEEAYTELYETLYESVDYLRTARGRKIIVLLSDGQNFPLDNNPDFPERHGMEGAIEFAQTEGISIFTIGLSTKADRKNLRRIAEQTGGASFSVYDPKKLKNLYELIREQILNEYLVSFRAGMEPVEKKSVEVVYREGENTVSAERYYFSGTIFGFGQERINFLSFIFIPLSVGLVWVLSFVRFERKKPDPSLTVFGPSGKKTIVHSLPVTRGRSELTIGGTEAADITISGDPKLTVSEAKIVEKDGVYTISGAKTPILVNNKPVRTKVLRPGDLIKIGDSTVVFDEGAKKEEKQREGTKKKQPRSSGRARSSRRTK
jgi:Ca-activated chloride channel family protein